MILYKKDTKGNVRYLEIKIEGPDLVQISGIVGTESPVEHRKTCIGKNLGKSNETTPIIQAQMEAKSKITDKLTEGYFETQDEAENGDVILPMLAKDYASEEHKIDWNGNVYVQPKLDGMRCLAFINKGEVILMSRKGKIIKGMDNIIKELSSKFKNEVITLDGELYVHGESFQKNMEAIKNNTQQAQYHVYDLVSTDSYSSRFSTLYSWLDPFGEHKFEHVKLVDTKLIKSEWDLKFQHQANIGNGYEGSIIRHGDEPYKVNGRSSNLLKYKDFQDIAAKIIDIEPAHQRPEWGVPVLEYEGKQFRAGMRYSHEDRKEFLLNKSNYIGKTAEIRFFEYSDEGIPRFPVMVGIRLDK